MDVLSDVLRVVRLSGAVFFVAEFTSPRAIESPPSRNLAHIIMPRAECFTMFHVLAEGTCSVRVKGEPPLQMVVGDVLVVPQGDEHFMASDLSRKPKPKKELLPKIPLQGTPAVNHGGGRDRALRLRLSALRPKIRSPLRYATETDMRSKPGGRSGL